MTYNKKGQGYDLAKRKTTRQQRPTVADFRKDFKTKGHPGRTRGVLPER